MQDSINEDDSSISFVPFDDEHEEYKNNRAAQLNFRPQKELFWNRYLPYADSLDEESSVMFESIKTALCKAISLRDLNPGVIICSNRLLTYLYLYDLKFSKEDHLMLIKIYVELIQLPNLDPMKFLFFSNILLKLLKKRLVGPNDLQLDWKPFYNLFEIYVHKTSNKGNFYQTDSFFDGVLKSVIMKCSIYFSKSSNKEILEEIFPKLQPLDVGKSCQVFEILSLFLNMHNDSYELWLDDFMNLWNTYHIPPWSSDLMNIIGYLAFENIGKIDWEPHLPIMFTRILKWIDLPVCYKKIKISKSYNFNVTSVAKFIIATLGPNKSGQEYLTKFIKTIESYLHPANFGKWLSTLGQLLSKITSAFVKRLEIERFSRPSWKDDVKETEKLTEQCITEFVESIKSAAFQTMYSRIDQKDVYNIFKNLSDLRPALIIPEVIDRVTNNLNSLTEPHRLTASFQCLISVSRALVSGHQGYTAGKASVIPILFAAIDGLDPNDLRKAFSTMNFYGAFLFQIPIIDSSKQNSYANDLTDEEIFINEQTAEFENFVLQLVQRLLDMIKFLTQENTRMEQININSNIKSRADVAVENSIAMLLQVIFGQCSKEINQAVAKKVISFVQSNLLDPTTAAPLLGIIVQSIGRNIGSYTYKILIPFLADKICVYLNEHQDASALEKQENDFLYYFTIYAYIFKSDPREVIKYLDEYFFPIMDIVLNFKCQLTAKVSSNLIRDILCDLSTLNIFASSLVENEQEDLTYRKHPIRQWGEEMMLNDKLNWFVPGKIDRDVCEKIIIRYLPQILEKLNNFISGKIEMCREDIVNNCDIIYAIICLCTYLPNWNEPVLEYETTVIDSNLIDKISLGLKSDDITMPNGDNIRLTVLNTIFELNDKIMRDCSDDIQTLKAIIKILSRIHKRKGYLTSFESEMHIFSRSKKFHDFKLVKNRRYIKPMVVKRAIIQQHCRNELDIPKFTKYHSKIMNVLLELSTSQYSAVRSFAQQKLSCMLHEYRSSYNSIVDQLIKTINLDANENHEKFKGVLYVLIGKANLFFGHDLNVFGRIWVNLLKSTPSEKLSIVGLMDTISTLIKRKFITPPIVEELTDTVISRASSLSSIEFTAEEIEQSKIRNENKNKKNLKAYNQLVTEIISIAEHGSIHWRCHLLASNMIEALVHPAVNYPLDVTRFYLDNLLNESIKERKISLSILIYVLEQIKRKHVKIPIDPFEIAGVPKPISKLPYGVRNDNRWLQYEEEYIPKNQEMWDKPIYLHKSDGFFGWSTNLQVHAPSSAQPKIDRSRSELSDSEKLFYDFFSDKNKVAKYIEFASLEENKGKEKFKQERFAFIKYIFRVFGDIFYLNIEEHLKSLILKNSIESNHRCAAEILSGIIQGMKHWSYEKVDNMYKNLNVIIKLALDNITVETDSFWGTCFATASENVDPRKQYWMYDILIEDLLTESTSFTGCCRIFCLQGPFNQHVWRMNTFAHRVLNYLKPFLNHSYQNVRLRLGSILINIFEADLSFIGGNKPLCPRIEDMIKEVLIDLAPLQEVINDVNDKKDSIDLSFEKQTEFDKSVRLFKTICHWIIGSISRSSNGNEKPYFDLLIYACRFEIYEQDVELAETCKTYLAVISQGLTFPDCFEYALNKFIELSSSKSWNTRLAVVDCLQVLTFHNIAIASCNEQWVKDIQNIVLRFLEDSNVEVQEKAAQVLGGFLHCSFIPNELELLKYFKRKCKNKIGSKNVTNEVNNIRTRHAGVLGLCAFISAHPYEIPDFLPDIFDQLANHLNDPQPIPSTIRKTICDFKRTHSDNWTIHKLKFTESQLDLLNDLTIPPSYYS